MGEGQARCIHDSRSPGVSRRRGVPRPHGPSGSRGLEGQVVVTGTSALAVQGVPLWGVDLKVVHVAREPGFTSRTDANVVHHVAPIPDSQLVEVNGLLVPVIERNVIDAARLGSFERGVVLADGARRLLPFDPDFAQSIVESQRDWPGSVKAARVLRFSDGAAETVGESRSRVMIARIGLPAPQLQKVLLSQRWERAGSKRLLLRGVQHCRRVRREAEVRSRASTRRLDASRMSTSARFSGRRSAARTPSGTRATRWCDGSGSRWTGMTGRCARDSIEPWIGPAAVPIC